jgi:hypothetical protein
MINRKKRTYFAVTINICRKLDISASVVLGVESEIKVNLFLNPVFIFSWRHFGMFFEEFSER